MKKEKRNSLITYYLSLISSKSCGFTLIELLVAASLLGIVSIVSVRLLFSTVSSRARQESIRTSSTDVQTFIETLSKTIKEAKRISVSVPSEISTEGTICRTFRLNGHDLEMAEDTSSECTAPTSGFVKLNNDNTYFDTVSFVKNDYEVRLNAVGYTKDAFGKHEFSYNTSIVKRTD